MIGSEIWGASSGVTLRNTLCKCTVHEVELLIETRGSKDSRVQAGLASPSPAFKGLVDSPEHCNIGPGQVWLTHNGLKLVFH